MKTALRVLTMTIALSTTLLLSNCSKDNDPLPAEMIVGNWQIASVNVDVKVGSKSFKDYLIAQGLTAAEAQLYADAFEGDYGDIDGNLDIKKGGTYSATSDGSTNTGTWELSSDGKTLTTDKGTTDESVFEVTALTSNSLKLSLEESEIMEGFEDEDDVTLTIKMEVSLTK